MVVEMFIISSVSCTFITSYVHHTSALAEHKLAETSDGSICTTFL